MSRFLAVLAVALTSAALPAAAGAEVTPGRSLHETNRPPDWIGTTLAGARLHRPAQLCEQRGGVARHRAYRMDGHPLRRRHARAGAYWVGELGNAVLDWHRGLHAYLSFARRPLLVAAWCALERPRSDRWVVRPDGSWDIP